MRFVVCIKQVPDAANVKFDPEKGTIIREGVESIINPFDLNAIEAAVQLKEQVGGEVICITMGPPQAESALRDALALGVDSAVLLSDRAFAGADTLATTRTLAAGIKKLGGADIVFCGKQAIDGDTAQVGPGLAVRLELNYTTCVSELSLDKDQEILKVKRAWEEGYDILELRLPALITVLTCINTPRVPSLKGKLKAKKAKIPVWGAKDLGLDASKVGLAGSPTQVVTTCVPKFEAKKEMLEGEVEEKVDALVEKLKEAGIL